MPWYDKKRKEWVADLRVGGKRYRQRGFSEKKIALLWEGQQRHNHELELVNLPTTNVTRIKNIVSTFLAYRKQYVKESTYRRNAILLKTWLNFFEFYHLDTTNDLDQNTWQKYRDWRKSQITVNGREPHNTTVNGELKIIGQCFGWAKKQKLVRVNPFEDVEYYKVKKEGIPRYLSLEEIKSIRDIAQKKAPDLYECFIVFISTGLRSGELCSLEVKDVDLQRKRIDLRPENTKSGYQRFIPLNGECLQIIDKHVRKAKENGQSFVFTTRNNTPYHGGNLYVRFKRIAKRAGIHDVTVHDLRRTYISQMIMQGVDPVKVMSIVGHQDWSTMKRYLALSPKYLSEDVDVLPY